MCLFNKRLKLRLENPSTPMTLMRKWKDLANRYACLLSLQRRCHWRHLSLSYRCNNLSCSLRRYNRLHNSVKICLVGKYTSLEDAYTSVTKALRHASLACNHKLDLMVCPVYNSPSYVSLQCF